MLKETSFSLVINEVKKVGQMFNEPELNQILKKIYDDFSILRRSLVDYDVDENVEVKATGKKELREEAKQILQALGGPENIEDVDACITRLRVAVKDPEKVDNAVLKGLGATDVLQVQGGIQAVYGAKAILYKNHINEILGVD